MKLLKKIQLVNWHYFINETIPIEGNTLVTGENGAGKSTILDAIQYVLSPGKQKFNVAANDGTKRTVNAYVRGKLGKSNQKYLREGDITCHIALEFYDNLKDKSFIVGCVLDSRDTITSPKQLFYDLDDAQIQKDYFMDESSVPLNIKEFKKMHKDKLVHANTMSTARKNIALRFNIADYNFFDLLPKALAFKPINNVKDFIYSYILEEKDLDIKYLIGNIKTYKEFINILENINEKLELLEKIDKAYKGVLSSEEILKRLIYVFMRLNVEELNTRIDKNSELRSAYEDKLKMLADESRGVKSQMGSVISKRDDVHLSLLTDDDYKLLSRLNTDKQEKMNKLNDYENLNTKIDSFIDSEYERAENLLAQGSSNEVITKFLAFKAVDLDLFNINEYVQAISSYYSYLNTKKNSIQEQRTLEVVKREILQETMSDIYSDIKTLNEKKVLIPNDVLAFTAELKKELKKRKEVDITPVILCEVLEINDTVWQNAVEGYLGRSRFNILVNPEYFTESLKIYKKIRHKYRSFPVSLVNSGKLNGYSKENARGLASQVSSNYSYAKNYINYRLNNLIMCDDVEDLPTHNLAVTADCIIYSGYTVSELSRRNYERLYIGNNASEKQLEQAYSELDAKKVELKKHNDTIKSYENSLSHLDLYNLSYIRDRIDVKIDIFNHSETVDELNKTIIDLENSSVIDKKQIIEKLESEHREMQSKLDRISEEIVLLNHKISQLESDEEVKQMLIEEKQKLEEYSLEISYLMNDAEKQYSDTMGDSINYEYTKQATELKIRSFEKEYLSKENDLILVQRQYNRDFSFAAEEGANSMEVFYAEQQRLRTSHLVAYEEKVHESKRRSEKELQEHFVFRLQESIIEATQHFEELNKSLSDIRFGTDEYRFVVEPNPRFSDYYDMLMDSVNFETHSEGFSDKFMKKHGKTLNKLTNYIIRENINDKFLEDIVDYRTYMDYDIKIMHDDDSISLLSEIAREKSGGETQIPYYVAMASTFIKIYQSNNVNSDSMGIVLFDEAFDKIDSTRTESMMKFLSNLGLQVIISTPPQKVEDIYPFVNSALVVTREKDYSWVFTLNKEHLN